MSDYRLIKLTKGYIAKVDPEDFVWLSKYKWSATITRGKLVYAKHSFLDEGKRNHVSMHRLLMEAKPNQDVDHINGDTLDNRKSNLRLCSHLDDMKKHGGFGNVKSR